MRGRFDEQLNRLATLKWDELELQEGQEGPRLLPPDVVLENAMKEIVGDSRGFANYLRTIFFDKREDLIEQSKGILFYLVCRHPEVFKKVQSILANFNTFIVDINLNRLIQTYSLYLEESTEINEGSTLIEQ